jgi:hypothetical protein
VSAGTHRLSEDDARWLARMNRVLRARLAEAARAEALREREREHCPAEDESRPDAVDGDHDAA